MNAAPKPGPGQPGPAGGLEPPATALIDTREELIIALTEAAELEHGLLTQYLFAAYSMKKSPAEGLSAAQFELVRRWESVILKVAREEMAHLGTVCNMLTAVGGTPRLGRPNFPQGRKGRFHKLRGSAYPFDFQLERFGEPALQRFIAAETPSDERETFESLAPDALQFDRLGELYRQIADAFRRLDEDYRGRGEQLFVGPPEAQDQSSWTANLNLFEVVDLESATDAIGFIVVEGEGSPADRAGSHYQRFVDVRSELHAELAASPAFAPARPVAITPMTRRHLDAGDGPVTLIPEDSAAAEVAQLFNAVYATTLLMLVQFYDYGGETEAQRAGLQASARQSMSAAVRPIAETLTSMPLSEGATENAGPGFELYADVQVPSHMPSRWIVLIERLGEAAAEASRLAALGPELARLHFVARNLELLTANVKALA
jgi:hypothetical protein